MIRFSSKEVWRDFLFPSFCVRGMSCQRKVFKRSVNDLGPVPAQHLRQLFSRASDKTAGSRRRVQKVGGSSPTSDHTPCRRDSIVHDQPGVSRGLRVLFIAAIRIRVRESSPPIKQVMFRFVVRRAFIFRKWSAFSGMAGRLLFSRPTSREFFCRQPKFSDFRSAGWSAASTTKLSQVQAPSRAPPTEKLVVSRADLGQTVRESTGAKVFSDVIQSSFSGSTIFIVLTFIIINSRATCRYQPNIAALPRHPTKSSDYSRTHLRTELKD